MTRAFSERQRREVDYHRQFASRHQYVLKRPVSYDVIYTTKRQWWNPYREMYWFLVGQRLKGKKVLVPGCGFGYDALRLAKLGAEVEAFDLSGESLTIAEQLARRERLNVNFREMAAEKLDYEPNSFDYVVATDILHHVDIPEAMIEISRTCKREAVVVVNEVYSHSWTDRIRYSAPVEKLLYPAMKGFVYKGREPYITDDERKLTQRDVAEIVAGFRRIVLRKYFGMLVNRVIPRKWQIMDKIETTMLAVISPAAHLLGGRVLIAGTVRK